MEVNIIIFSFKDKCNPANNLQLRTVVFSSSFSNTKRLPKVSSHDIIWIRDKDELCVINCEAECSFELQPWLALKVRECPVSGVILHPVKITSPPTSSTVFLFQCSKGQAVCLLLLILFHF